MVDVAANMLDGSDRARSPGRNLLDVAALRALSGRSDLRGGLRLAAHVAAIAGTACLVWLARPDWYLLIPAMALHGVTIVTLFAPLHECVHRTAFASPAANAIIGWIAGVLCFYNATYYRHYHAWHHRYTQDPARDPELMYPTTATGRLAYFIEISAIMFWVRRAIDYPALALGHAGKLPFVPASARRRVALSMSAQLLVYAVALVAIVLGYRGALFYWFLPALLAQPVLRGMLIAEHTGCSADANGLTNTRTTLASLPVRLLMWNMPFHAEHHLYPAIPFHRLPEAHAKLGDKLAHVASGYVAANLEVLGSLGPAHTSRLRSRSQSVR
jgi:fatty acid desaturase